MAKRDKRAGVICDGLSRHASIDRERIDREKRTVELSFSSEEPVERWGENEVLSHDKDGYDFDRVASGNHPLLLGHDEHDPESQIGVIQKAWVGDDKKGRAVVRFGNSAKANEIFQDVQEGIRSNISVGYDRTGIISSDKAKDGRVTTFYKWMPTHIAIVPVPADTTVGVGRGKERMVKRRCADCDGNGRCRCRENAEDDADENCEDCGGNGRCKDCGGNGYIETAKSKPVVDSLKDANADQIFSQLNNEQKTSMRILFKDDAAGGGGGTVVAPEITERARFKEISALADTASKDHGQKDNGQMRETITTMAREAIEKGESIPDFKLRLWETLAKATPAKVIGKADVMSEKDARLYSLGDAVKNAANNETGTACIPKADTREGEAHLNMVKLAKENPGTPTPSGFLVPWDVDISSRAISRKALRALGRPVHGKRDMQVDIFAQGGAFVPVQMVVPIIELLRNMMVLDKVGVRHMAGLQGNIVIPRQTAPATAYSVSEIGALTASNQTLDQLQLTPKRVGATQTYSKQFVFQSTPDAEAFLRDDLFKVIALNWDYLGLNGTGNASQPLGIINSPGIGGVTFGATPTYIKMVLFETTIRNANVMDEISYVSTTATRGSLKTVAEALTGATTIGGRQNAIWQGSMEDGTVNYCQAIASNQIPNNVVIAGAFEHLIHAMWSGMDVVVDNFTKAANAEVVISINTWGDFALRHPQAFCVSTDAGNQ